MTTLNNQAVEFQISTKHLPMSLEITYYFISVGNLTLHDQCFSSVTERERGVTRTVHGQNHFY